jgi:hypothetical protein
LLIGQPGIRTINSVCALGGPVIWAAWMVAKLCDLGCIC